jgi:hypothetical protein
MVFILISLCGCEEGVDGEQRRQQSKCGITIFLQWKKQVIQVFTWLFAIPGLLN